MEQSKMKTSLVVFLTVFASLRADFQLKKCDFGKKNFGRCMGRRIEEVAQQLTKPIPEVGLPNLEPLDIKSFVIGKGSGPVGVQEEFEDATMYGLKNIKIKYATMVLEPTTKLINLTCEFDYLEIRAKYHLNGKVLLLPIEGRGDVVIKLKNLTAVLYSPFELIKKNDKIYLHSTPDAKILLPKLDLLDLNFMNLYNGNKQLGDNINKVLNENWVEIFDDVRSGWENFFTNTIIGIFDGFFSKVSLTDAVDNLDLSLLN